MVKITEKPPSQTVTLISPARTESDVGIKVSAGAAVSKTGMKKRLPEMEGVILIRARTVFWIMGQMERDEELAQAIWRYNSL